MKLEWLFQESNRLLALARSVGGEEAVEIEKQHDALFDCLGDGDDLRHNLCYNYFESRNNGNDPGMIVFYNHYLIVDKISLLGEFGIHRFALADCAGITESCYEILETGHWKIARMEIVNGVVASKKIAFVFERRENL